MTVTHKKGRWIGAAGGFMACVLLVAILYSMGDAIVIVLAGEVVLSLLLFEECVCRILCVWLFSFSYLSFIYEPIHAVFRDFFVLVHILVIAVILIIGVLLRRNAADRLPIKEIHAGYFAVAGLIAFIDSGITIFVNETLKEMSMSAGQLVQALNIILSFLLYFMGLMFLATDLIRIRLQKDNAIKAKYIELQMNHYEQIMENMHEVRRIKHDINRHLESVSQYLQKGEYEAAISYFHEIEVTTNAMAKFPVCLGNELIDTIIYDYSNRNKEITIQGEGSLPKKSGVSEYVLCTIFSNLLSNAAEACAKLSHTKKQIVIKAGMYKKYMTVEFSNPVEWEINAERIGEFSTKEEKNVHGYGLHNVMQAVRENGGDIRFTVENGMFCVNIVLPAEEQ